MKLNKSKTLLVVISVFIIGLAIYFVYYSQITDQTLVTQSNISSNSNTESQVTTKFKTYSNKAFGISFEQPADWPAPIERPGVDYGSFDPESLLISGKSQWNLDVGPIGKGACEGSDCYMYKLESFPPQDPDQIMKTLKSDETVRVYSDTKINGNRVFIFASGGICGDKNGMIFGVESTVDFVARCADDMPGNPNFDRIINSFRFIK